MSSPDKQHKAIVIGMSSAAGACVLALASVLAWMYANPETLEPALPPSASSSIPTSTNKTINCGEPPVVDAATGAVTNPTHLIMPDGKTCGENVNALSTLCLQSRCTDPTKCTAPNSSWDVYSSGGKACLKVTNPTCEQQACDAPYCTSASMVASVPLQHKITANDRSCFNPSEVSVAALCNNLDGGSGTHVYVFPDCRVAETQKVILTRTFTKNNAADRGTAVVPAAI